MEHTNCKMPNKSTAREQKLKANLLARLAKIEGQVRGISGMIDKDAYCDDVINQIAAARSALDSTARLVLENHMHSCLVEKIKDGDETVVDELIKTIGKLL